MRLNLEPQTRPPVESMLAAYERRDALLRTSRAALVELLDDGHPDIPVREIDTAAWSDLFSSFSTI